MPFSSEHQSYYHPDHYQKLLSELLPTLTQQWQRFCTKDKPVLQQLPVDQIIEDLGIPSFIQEGHASIPDLIQKLIEHASHIQSPRHMGHQVAVPTVFSAIADCVNGVLNNPIGIYEMGPAGVAIEHAMVHWMLSKVGWEGTGEGVMVHGGSLANLTCLLSARAHALPEAWTHGTSGNGVIIASESSHYSVARAASIIGLGSSSILKVPVDEYNRMHVDALKQICLETQQKNIPIVAVIANACVTATGMYDALDEIGPFCQKHHIWLHVDGAHGASALISPKYQHLMQGVAYANSLIWDTHKMLGTSSLCGAALFRKKEFLKQTFNQDASYLKMSDDKPGKDLFEDAVECTKSQIALKLLLNLAVMGEQGLGEHVTHLYDQGRRFYDIIEAHPHFSCLNVPETNIICFRYEGPTSKVFDPSEDINDWLRQQVVLSGKFYITRATIHGKSYLRLTISNPFTSEEEIQDLLQTLVEFASF